MSEAEDTQPLITLKIDTGEQNFASIEELRTWVDGERNAFGWIQTIQREDRNLQAIWSNMAQWWDHIGGFILNYEARGGHPEVQQQLKESLISDINRLGRYTITAGSADAEFVSNLRNEDNEHADGIAAYALLNLSRENINLHGMINMHGLEGIYRALQYRQGTSETATAQVASLERLKKDWGPKFSNQHREVQEQQEWFNTFTQESDAGFRGFMQESDARFLKFMQESETKIANMEKTFKEAIALRAPVTYWKEKQESHRHGMQKAGWFTFGCGLISLGLIICLAVWLLQDTATNTPLWKIGIVFATSTFTIWLTQLSAKIFMSNLHLNSDAHERTTMIQTYLALLSEDKGPSSEERQLMLQTLFRPSASGFVKDSGPHGFYEALSNMMSKSTDK